jgi:hypothetical protein
MKKPVGIEALTGFVVDGRFRPPDRLFSGFIGRIGQLVAAFRDVLAGAGHGVAASEHGGGGDQQHSDDSCHESFSSWVDCGHVGRSGLDVCSMFFIRRP